MNTIAKMVVRCGMIVALLPGVIMAGDGQADLDKALQLKIVATKLPQLQEVADLCESAINKGLEAENEQFARDLLVGALYQRAEQLTEAMVKTALSGPTSNWQKLRSTALADLTRILEYKPDFAEAYIMIVRLQMLPGGDRAVAKKSVAKSVALLQKSADKSMLAEALVLRGELAATDDLRSADFNAAIKMDPTNIHALEARARFYQKQGKLEQALVDLRALLERQENNIPARLAVVEALANLKQYDEALKQVNALIKMRPGSIAYGLRAQLYARLDKTDEAIADCDTALKENADDLAVRLLRAQLYFRQKRNALAAEDLRYLMKARPGMSQTMGLSALVQAAQGDLEKAIELLQAVIEQDPTQLSWKLQLGALYHLAKHPRKAIAVYDEVLKTAPGLADALQSRADVLLSVGDYAKALSDYERVSSLDPKNAAALNNFAWLLATAPDEKIRDGKRAIELATKACELTKYKEAYILSTLAAAYAETGDFDAAIKWSEKAVGMEGDQRDQLRKELENYKQQRPWRESPQAKPDEEEAAAGGKSVEGTPK